VDKVEALLDESVEGFAIPEYKDHKHIYDLSKIDFEALQKKFKKGRKRTELEILKSMIEKTLDTLVQANRTRMDFKERYQELIDEYIRGVKSLDDIFQRLLKFTQELRDEEKRYIREGLESEEELAVFDILTKPEMKLSKKEIMETKRIARQLLETLKKEKLVLDWRKKQTTRAGVKLTIEETLDMLPEAYTIEAYKNKCDLVYQYVYDLEPVVSQYATGLT
jgi:type I restriction enzyme R subunit